MTRLICAAATVTSASFENAPSAMAYCVVRRMKCSSRITNAGPAVKAEARNRGPSSAVFQNGRDGSPARRKAVTR